MLLAGENQNCINEIEALLQKQNLAYENLINKSNLPLIELLALAYLRLVAYIKMNENNNEIATLSGVSLRTVETQRYRLSKILKLKDDQDLDSYIKNI